MTEELKNTCECEHEFTLILSGANELTTEIEDALYEAGCDDATLSLRYGTLFLAFCRLAPSLKDAILSAIRDVRKVGLDVSRVSDCNLVTQAVIARKIDRTRQQVHQLVAGMRGPGGFPSPVCQITDGAPLWMWCEVANWLWQNNMIKKEVLKEAREVSAINTVLELKYHRNLEPELLEEVARLLSEETRGVTT